MANDKKKKGRWVAFEGPDGVGKTTLVKAVHEALRARGRSVYATAQPSKGPIGQLLRKFLVPDDASLGLNWQSMALLFAADRKDQFDRDIAPSLASFRYVLTDRGPLSNLIYQTLKAVEGIDANNLPMLMRKYQTALSWLQQAEASVGRPDLTFVLGLSPELAAERRAQRGGPASVYEQSDMQRRIAAMYAHAVEAHGELSLSLMMDDMLPLDASKSVTDLVDECIEKMDAAFGGDDAAR